MINFNKKDPVADAVKAVMEKELSPAQKKIAALAGDKKTIDALDLAALRAGKKPTSEETVEENAFDYKSPRQPEPNGGSGVKKGSRYGGSKQKEKPEQDEDKMKKEESEQVDEADKLQSRWMHQPNLFGTKSRKSTIDKKREELKSDIKNSLGKHTKPNLPEEIDPSDRTEDTLSGRVKTKQKDDVGPKSDSRSTKVRYSPGPMTLKKMKENYEEQFIDEMINEVLSKDASAGDWIHDFVHSDNPKFAGKSKAERKKQALAAYYSKKNEEVNEGLKSVAKKAFKALTGGSDEDQRKDLQKKMGVPQTGQKPTQKEEVEQIEEALMTGITLGKKVKNDEGGHDQDVHHKGAKIGTISSYSHRTGTKYGMSHDASGDAMAGSRSHEEALSDLRQAHAEHLKSMKNEEVVMEGRTPVSSPGMDTPFVTDAENKPLNHAKELASKTMKRIKTEMLGKAGTSE